MLWFNKKEIKICEYVKKIWKYANMYSDVHVIQYANVYYDLHAFQIESRKQIVS
jgi:hypothetical protein